MSSRAWRFYVDSYFPYMYGLMLIEELCEQSTEELKEKFTKETIRYLEQENIFYIEDELKDILKFNIKEFRKVLLTEYHKWEMEDIIEIVKRILKEVTV